MNQKTAIVALAVTLVLACVTWIALRVPPVPRTPEAPARSWLADIPRVTWTSARIEWGEEPAAAGRADLFRVEALDLWLLRTAPGGPAWPIEPARVRGLLRIIADADATPAPDGQVSTLLCTLTLVAADGAQRSIEVRRPVVGGGAVVRIRDGDGEVSRMAAGDLVSAVRAESVASWRVAHAFPDAPAQATGLTLNKDAKTLAMSRADRRWHITHPFGEQAETDAAGALLARCGRLSAARMLDTPIEEHAGWITAPRAALVLQRDVRVATVDGEIERFTLSQELLVGPAAAEPERVLAVSRATLAPAGGGAGALVWGPLLLTLRAEDFDALGVDALPYTRATGLALSAADAGEVHLRRPALGETPAGAPRPPAPGDLSPPGGAPASQGALVRTIGGWQRHSIMHAGTPLDSRGAAEAGALLTLLCDTPADRLSLGAPEGATLVCALAVRSVGGQLAAHAQVLRLDDPGGVMIGVRAGAVTRLFGGEPARRALAFIAELLPEEG